MSTYCVKFYIQDQHDEWVDFTDKIETRGKNKVSSISSVSHKNESKAFGGAFVSSLGDVVMENTDRFWDKPSMWSSLTTENNTVASFSGYTSTNNGEIDLTGLKCKVIVEDLQKDSTVKEESVGVFKIRDIVTDSYSGTAALKIESLSQVLKRIDASKVKFGKEWYANKPIVFLMKELLKLEYADTSGNLPTGFTFPDNVTISTYDGERALSSFGRPPEYIASSGEWVDLGYVTRALVWSNSSVLQKGIFMGCDENLYLYSIESDSYALIGSTSSGYNIKRLWVNGNTLYGVSWQDPDTTNPYTTIRIISYDGDTFSSTITISQVFTGEYHNRNGARLMYYDDPPPDDRDKYAAFIGQTNETTPGETEDTTSGENILVPFSQYVYNLNPDVSESYTAGTSIFDTVNVSYVDDEDISITYQSGYYGFMQNNITLYDDPEPFCLRHTYGQYGFCEFIENYGVSGGIVYAYFNDNVWDDDLTYKIYDISSDTSAVITGMSNYSINSTAVFPTCACADPSNDVFYFGGQAWYEVSGNTDSRSYIIKVSDLNGTASQTILYQSTDDTANVYRTFLDMKYADDATGYLYLNFLNRDKLGTGMFGGIGRHSLTSLNDINGYKEFSSIPTGLIVDDKNKDAYITTVDGTLYKYSFTLPTVTTQAVSDISYTTATGNGNITSVGGADEFCSKRGICWSTSTSPTVDDSKNEETGTFSTGAFSRSMSGLSHNTKYYVKAFAYNEKGYAYGDQVSFTTLTPSLTITAPNGGEIWEVDTEENITWTRNYVTYIKIEYSSNNGSSWTVVDGSVAAAGGTYPWTIPNDPSGESLVKITSITPDDDTIYDISDAVFSIISPI